MSNKFLIIMMGLFIIFVGIMGTGLFIMWGKVSALDQIVNPPSQKSSQEAGNEASQQAHLGPIYSLDTFIVNLSDPGGNRFLRATMDLEVKSEDIRQEIEKRLPQVRDSILMTLPSRRVQDIQSAEGKIALRNELMTKLDALLEKKAIINIYFTEFVIQ
jgi:flagellar FliL protein